MYCSRTLEVYILRETLKVFILAAIAVNFMMTFAAILTYLHKQDLPIVPFVKVVLCHMPQLFQYTLPMALLLAVTLTYGRMASDNEVMAMQASGIHMLWVILPGMVLGVALTGTIYLVNDYLLPYCERKEHSIAKAAVPEALSRKFQTLRSFAFKRWLLEWESARGDTIYKLKVIQTKPDGEPIMRCEAQSATYHLIETVDPETGKSSYELQLIGRNVTGWNFPDVWFSAKEKELTIPPTELGIERRDPGAKATSIGRLLEYVGGLREEIAGKNREATGELATLRTDSEATLKRLRGQLKEPEIDDATVTRVKQQIEKAEKGVERKEKEVKRLISANNGRLRKETNDVFMKIHLRLSLATSALAMVLVGMPLGILSGRSHMLKAFVLACVPVLVFYYPLFMLGRNLADTHVLSAGVALWSPTVLQMGIGAGLIGYLFRR